MALPAPKFDDRKPYEVTPRELLARQASSIEGQARRADTEAEEAEAAGKERRLMAADLRAKAAEYRAAAALLPEPPPAPVELAPDHVFTGGVDQSLMVDP